MMEDEESLKKTKSKRNIWNEKRNAVLIEIVRSSKYPTPWRPRHGTSKEVWMDIAERIQLREDIFDTPVHWESAKEQLLRVIDRQRLRRNLGDFSIKSETEMFIDEMIRHMQADDEEKAEAHRRQKERAQKRQLRKGSCADSSLLAESPGDSRLVETGASDANHFIVFDEGAAKKARSADDAVHSSIDAMNSSSSESLPNALSDLEHMLSPSSRKHIDELSSNRSMGDQGIDSMVRPLSVPSQPGSYSSASSDGSSIQCLQLSDNDHQQQHQHRIHCHQHVQQSVEEVSVSPQGLHVRLPLPVVNPNHVPSAETILLEVQSQLEECQRTLRLTQHVLKQICERCGLGQIE